MTAKVCECAPKASAPGRVPPLLSSLATLLPIDSKFKLEVGSMAEI